MNAAIQALLSLPSFTESMRSENLKALLASKSRDNVKFPLYNAILQIANAKTESKGDAAMLKSVMDCLCSRFHGNHQQDAHEFLNDLIDFLHDEFMQGVDKRVGEMNEETSDERKSNTSDATSCTTTATSSSYSPSEASQSLFSPPSTTSSSTSSSAGSLSSPKAPKITPSNPKKESALSGCDQRTPFPTELCFECSVNVRLCCNSCKWARRKVEVYRNFSLDVDVEEGEGEGNVSSIEEALGNYFKAKVVDIDCERCEDGKQATQTMEIDKLPGVLLLHLKRIIVSDTNGNLSYRKNKSEVAFKDSVDLSSYASKDLELSPSALFSLKSVVHHIGNDVASGHYVTDAKGEGGTWTKFNDSLATNVSADEVFRSGKQTAYILAFETVGGK